MPKQSEIKQDTVSSRQRNISISPTRPVATASVYIFQNMQVYVFCAMVAEKLEEAIHIN